jgi:competence protein ComEA
MSWLSEMRLVYNPIAGRFTTCLKCGPLLFLALTQAAASGEERLQGVTNSVTGLTRFSQCELVATDWADGDSFSVRFPDGKARTIRLYGVDCLESHVVGKADATRLRAQGRYFGIWNLENSIALAKGLGHQAAKRAKVLLTNKFIVHTAWADARGDARYKRYYGFVTMDSGKDLAAELVRAGLARPVGVYRRTPTGISRDEYRQQLKDLELAAASSRAGAWALTDWKSLPEERRVERKEEADLAAAQNDAALPPGARIDPNTAARDELMRLPGIGQTKANAIIESRADGKFLESKDLLRVPGIGPKILAKLEPHLKY